MRAADDFAELVEESELSTMGFAEQVLEVEESTLRKALETGRGLNILELYMLRDEDAARFVTLYLRYLDERREAREAVFGTTG